MPLACYRRKAMEQYRKSPRANFLDYDEGTFFVTICTKNRSHFFGEIANGEMQLSEIGKYVDLQLQSASVYCEDIEVPLFVVMPNHIHAIICCRDMPSVCLVGNNMEANIQQRNPNPSLRANPTCQRHVPTLSRYLSSLKGAVTKFAKLHNMNFGWQARYYDHYIRGNHDGNRVSEYIINNVANWQKDCFFENEVQIQDTRLPD